MIYGILVGMTALGFMAVGSAAAECKIEFRAAENQPVTGLMEMVVQGSNRRVYVINDVLLTAADIESAVLKPGEGGVPQIEIIFTDNGNARFSAATGASIGKPLAIIIDDTLISAPIVREKITSGRVIITGSFSEEEAKRIVDGLGANE